MQFGKKLSLTGKDYLSNDLLKVAEAYENADFKREIVRFRRCQSWRKVVLLVDSVSQLIEIYLPENNHLEFYHSYEMILKKCKRGVPMAYEVHCAYLRKSRSDDPGEDVQTTIARHKTILLEVSQKLKIPITEFYEEVVTGDSIFIRPEMMRLLSDVEQGKYAAVFVVDIDRLGRGGQKDAGIILETFKYSDTKIITPEKTYDLNNELDEEMAEFKTFMSRREYKMITKRLQRGIAQTVKDGGYIANAPYGYVKTTISKRPSLEIHESEAVFVRMMFEMYADGIGCETISTEINRLGGKPHRAETFGRTSIQRIITNPAYCGKVIWNRTKWTRKGQRGSDKTYRKCMPRESWIITNGMHPPVVTTELFDKVQEIYKSRYHPPSNTGEIQNPFASLITCKQCGKYINLLRSKKECGNYSYHRCATKGCCAMTASALLEQKILETLTCKLTELEISAKQATTISPNVAALKSAVAEIKKELAILGKQKSHLHDLLEQGIYTPPVFSERSGVINEKISSLYEQKQAQEEIIQKLSINIPLEQATRLRTALSSYATASAGERNFMLKSVVDHMVYYKEKKSSRMDFTIDIFLREVF